MTAETNGIRTDAIAARRRLWRVAWGLARNDFHARFAGSYFGILWAFAQPVATILLFWFVFQVGFRAAPTRAGEPYGLWLAAGLTPWFYPTLSLDSIWFAGSGLFLLALGLANCAAGKTRSRPIRVSVVVLNVVATMHATALAFLLGA